jgi:hypothetical protein
MMTVPEKCRESRRMGKSSNNRAQSDPEPYPNRAQVTAQLWCAVT